MTDIATLLAAPDLAATAYPPTSRYHGIGLMQITLADGTTRAYLKRRFVPQPGDLDDLGGYSVRIGKRADTIAADAFGDATQGWRLSDANGGGFQQLTTPVDRVLRIAITAAGRSTSGA